MAELRRKTAPQVLAERARAQPQGVAFRAKQLGLYRAATWRGYAERVACLAQGFAGLGFTRGERIAIMGDACPEWLYADLACQALGGITYGIYPTASAAEVEYQMRDGGARIFVAENQEYVDRILPLADRLPNLEWIVVIDTTAMFAYRHPKLRTLAELEAPAQAGGDAALTHLEQLAAQLSPDDPAFIVYTSGTTGSPKGALISHGRHLAGTYNLVAHYPQLREAGQRTAVFLPLCHVLGRDIAVTLPLISGLTPYFGESVDDLPQTLFEVAPTVLFTVPRYLQKIASQILVGVANTSTLKRVACERAISFGRAHAKRRWEGRAGGLDALAYRVAEWAVFKPMLNKFGLNHLRLAISGGAPLPPETMALWQILGVNVAEIYGQTETAGAIISGQRGPFARPGNVGELAAGFTLKLAQNGEILLNGDYVFDGYWNNPQATREVLSPDGWLSTGDVGEHAGGQLKLVDRARDFLVTAGGKTISPAHVENVLRASPYIGEVVVFGHARKYLTALIEIDYDTVSDWARAHDVSYTGFTSLTAHPSVVQLLESEIERVNADLARVEQVKKFRVLPKALDPEEEGEPVTPTRKVKRKLMYERFKAQVESMYDDVEERLVAAGAGNVLDAAGIAK